MGYEISQEDSGILWVRLSGMPNGPEIIEATHAAYEGRSFKHALWDYRDSSLSSISAGEFRQIIAASLPYIEPRGPGAKTAIVCRTDADLMLVTAYAEMASTQSTIGFAGFTDADEALAWFKKD